MASTSALPTGSRLRLTLRGFVNNVWICPELSYTLVRVNCGMSACWRCRSAEPATLGPKGSPVLSHVICFCAFAVASSCASLMIAGSGGGWSVMTTSRVAAAALEETAAANPCHFWAAIA